MKNINKCGHCLFIALALLASVHQAAAQGTAFLYQGQLQNDGGPANGTYNLTFSLFTASSGGSQVGGTVTTNGVGVSNGLFTVTIDFGSSPFRGATNWLQIGVESNGVSPFTTLTPRQQITPVPYAIFATTASNVTGTVPAGQIGGPLASGSLSGTYSSAVTLSNPGNSFSGNGGGLTNLNASQLIGGAVPDALLSDNVALLNANQTFTGSNAITGGNASFTVSGTGPISTSIFTGLGLQFYNNSGEGAIMSSVNDANSSLTFYTKQGPGILPAKQMKIDRYGVVMIDQQNVNNGVLNDGTTNGVGLTFGNNSGEGIASQRTAGVNQDGLDFYTGNSRQMSILHNGNVGMGTTNPTTALQVIGTVTATAFSGNGGSLTNLNASQLSGTIPLSQLPATVGLLSDTGGGNFFAGLVAGNTTLSGIRNSGMGDGALQADTSGFENTASGFDALNSDKTGADNTASGVFALGDDTSGSENTALGAGALSANTTGGNNVAIGSDALQDSRSGSDEVAIGYEALQNDNTGGGLFGTGGNTAVGFEALQANTAGSDNTALGWQALISNTNGVNNTALGFWALLDNKSATQNTGVGAFALESATTGGNNVAVGYTALASDSTGTENVAIGVSALGNSPSDGAEVAVGYEALENDNTGGGLFGTGGNTAVGYEALQQNNSGGDNSALGWQALISNTSGVNNTSVGFWALLDNTTGSENTAEGAFALEMITNATDNTAVGYDALPVDVTGSGNVAVGVSTLQADTAGFGNTALGSAALYVATGNNNIGIGNGGGDNLTGGNNNIDIGNTGNAADNGIIRIGIPGTQTGTFLAGQIAGNAGLNIDQTGTYGANNGTVTANALTFGTGPGGSGEGIASQRTSGANQFDLTLFTAFDPRVTILSGGNVGIGTTSPQSALDVNGTTRTGALTITAGSDLAEPFKISTADQPVSEGEVVVIDEANPGQLKLTDQPYDTRVAGVISGANGIHPGIQMQQLGLLEGGRNVALTGRVYVQADASNGAIRPGDLLTTPSTPGRAMRVSDHAKAQGAILGKAMTGLNEGQGMVLVLVTLQ